MASRRRATNKTITGNISDIQRRVRFLNSKPSPSKIGNQAVVRSNIQPRAVGTDQLALRAVVNSTIEDNAINAAKLAADSVGNSELDSNSVDSENYIDRSIDSEHYAIGSVDGNAVGPDAIGNSELDANSTDSENYIDRSIDPEHYGIGSVDSTAVGGNAINNEEMNDNSINSAEYVDGSIDPEHFANGAVDGAAIGDNAVGAGELGSNAVDSDAVVANSISGSRGGGKNHIAPDSIGQDDIAPDSIGLDELQIDSVNSAIIIANGVITENINDSAVTTAKINNLAVTNAKIANGTIQQAKFASSVSFPPADGSVTAAKLASQAVNYSALVVNVPQQIVNNVAKVGTYLSKSPLIGPGSPGVLFDARTGTSSSTLAVGNHTHSTFTPVSSRRFKTAIEDYQIDDVKKILQLNPVKFKYKAQYREQQHMENSHRAWMLGYIAEDVEDLGIDEVVGYDTDGAPSSLRYDLLTVLAIELLKSHQDEIDSLKEEIKRLKEEK